MKKTSAKIGLILALNCLICIGLLKWHKSVFLDELPEYKRSALEVMRQPLEDRHITVARTKETVDYPASFMLVAAMNPCPCGHYGENNPAHPCTCTPGQVHRYLSKISGPLLDRIDIQCEIEAVPYEQLKDTSRVSLLL